MKKFIELLFLKQLDGIGNSTINSKFADKLLEISGLDECANLVRSMQKYTEKEILRAVNVAKEKYGRYINDDISIITVFDTEYPNRFHLLKNKKPVIIYAKGNTEILKKPNLAVVGTREPSAWSIKVEKRLVKKVIDLSDRVIVSGLALGCDKIAHQTAVDEKKPTIAVLPCGIDVITPASNQKLAHDIVSEGGLLISEYEPDCAVTKASYVQRDSLIATLSDAAFVIECKSQGGTMHTVNACNIMNIPVACFYAPGTSAFSGNEYLLQNKKAVRVSNTVELTNFLEMLSDMKAQNNKTFSENQKPIQMSFLDI